MDKTFQAVVIRDGSGIQSNFSGITGGSWFDRGREAIGRMFYSNGLRWFNLYYQKPQGGGLLFQYSGELDSGQQIRGRIIFTQTR